MTNTTIIPATERKLKNHVGVGTTIRNTCTLAYRALLKMFKSPEIFVDFVVLPVMFTLLIHLFIRGSDFGQHPELSADCYPRRFINVIFHQLYYRGY